MAIPCLYSLPWPWDPKHTISKDFKWKCLEVSFAAAAPFCRYKSVPSVGFFCVCPFPYRSRYLSKAQVLGIPFKLLNKNIEGFEPRGCLLIKFIPLSDQYSPSEPPPTVSDSFPKNYVCEADEAIGSNSLFTIKAICLDLFLLSLLETLQEQSSI